MASISLTLPVSGTQITAGLHSTNYGAIQTVINGGLDNTNIASGAAIAPSKLAGYPSSSLVFLRGDGTWASASSTAELDYAAITSDSAGITATTEGTSTVFITGNAVTYDGSTRVKLEVFGHHVGSGVLTPIYVIYRGSTVVGHIASPGGTISTTVGSFGGAVFDTPPAGSQTYKIAAYVGANTLTVKAGAGGAGALVPAFLRVTRA